MRPDHRGLGDSGLAPSALRTHLRLAALTPGATPFNNRTYLEQPDPC